MKVPMTPRGYAKLRKELQRLKAMRPELAKAIEVARGHGDLSENADYDAAKEHSGLVEAKIRDIEARLSNAQVIDPRKTPKPTRVVFGCSVKIEEIDSGESKVLTIVGSEESDVERGWISNDSPIARGLIGKEEGDTVRIKLPAGEKEYEVLELFVEYSEESLDAESSDSSEEK